MREILFRGKSYFTDCWWYGSLIIRQEATAVRHATYYICKVGDDGIEYKVKVIPETVGQYTELKDKTGEKIFEGDIITWFINGREESAPVEYLEGAFFMTKDINNGYGIYNDWLRGEYEVIGNIHDNPELLKKGA